MLSRRVEVPEAGAWTVARRSLSGDLPLRYQHKLQFEFDRMVDDALREGMSVLDVGSGRRPCIPPERRPAGCTYVGLDISGEELEAAPPGSYDRFVVADVSDRAVDLGSQFDLVLSFQVLEHVRPLSEAFENLRHYLKPGGRLIAQFSGALCAFGLLGRAVPHRLSRSLVHHLLGRDPEKVFPAHYDHCWASALRRMLVPWGSADVIPLHRGASYFHFAKPLRAGYLLYEEWIRSRNFENLASYYIVDAVRGDDTPVSGSAGRSDPAPRVLHVSVNAGSGVAAAIGDYVANSVGFEHHLLLSRDASCQIGAHLDGMATSVTELPPGRLAKVRCLRATTEALQPDIIHAHSSYAGGYVRLALPRRWQSRVVYTPQCYAFERTDVPRALRRAFWLVESALSFRGSEVAACSPLEVALARSLPGPQRVSYVPNAAPPSRDLPIRSGTGPAAPGVTQVSAAGRVSPQKAPEIFADAARRSDRSDLSWVWIGGGDIRQEELLRDAGVEVTGWLSREEALRRLADSHVYVHTASWEGAPMTILEAAAAGVPVVARRTPAMEALGVDPLFESVPELVDLVHSFPDGPAATAAALCGEMLRRNHSSEAQRTALEAVYSRLLNGDRAPSARVGDPLGP